MIRVEKRSRSGDIADTTAKQSRSEAQFVQPIGIVATGRQQDDWVDQASEVPTSGGAGAGRESPGGETIRPMVANSSAARTGFER